MHPFIKRYPIISDQIEPNELQVILLELERVLAMHIPGDVVEFGCYEGTTSLFLQRLLLRTGRQLHTYDSFAGLPPKTKADVSPAGEQFRAGELAASKTTFIKHFRQAGLPLPVIHKGWFSQLAAQDVPTRIAFAFLDGDFYESIWQSLQLIWPQLAPGAVVIVDDYQSEALPGARLAVDTWLQTHQAQLRTQASLAILST